MSCRVSRTTGGGVRIACTRREIAGMPPVPRCACGALGVRRCRFKPNTDHPAAGWAGALGLEFCDKPLCDRCAVPIGPGREQCPDHPRPS